MDSLYLNHSEFMSKCKLPTAKQNQKFPFHFVFWRCVLNEVRMYFELNPDDQ